jgi:hypothetical protein
MGSYLLLTSDYKLAPGEIRVTIKKEIIYNRPPIIKKTQFSFFLIEFLA